MTLSVTATANDYMQELFKTPARAMVLFLDVSKDLPEKDRLRLQVQVNTVSKCLSCIPAEDLVPAIKWLRAMPGQNA